MNEPGHDSSQSTRAGSRNTADQPGRPGATSAGSSSQAKQPGRERALERRLLRGLLWTYIILCLLIAGLNYGYASRATPDVAAAISRFWHFYENDVKTVFIVAGSILTLRIAGASQRTAMRRRSLIGFTVTALAIHIIGPVLLNNPELYFFAMPLPWTTSPLQLLAPASSFAASRAPLWGAAGVSAVMVFYLAYSGLVLAGTLIDGRRWQCATLCLFNGFAAEVFDPVIPLLGRRQKGVHGQNKRPMAGPGPRTLHLLAVMRWLFLAMAIGLSAWWLLYLAGAAPAGNPTVIGQFENYKYLSTELLMAMFFWVAFIGRGYCHYCPLGTVAGALSRIAGQRIETAQTRCIRCGRCDEACPMSIGIRQLAETGQPVRNSTCVGCGHCVDICPTKTLAYTTAALSRLERLKGRRPKG